MLGLMYVEHVYESVVEGLHGLIKSRVGLCEAIPVALDGCNGKGNSL